MSTKLPMMILSALMVTPMGWLIATTEFSGDRGQIVVAGGLAACGALLFMAWRMHFAGKLLPYRCKTCQTGMARVKAGELKPPPGATSKEIRWRCHRCGRLE